MFFMKLVSSWENLSLLLLLLFLLTFLNLLIIVFVGTETLANSDSLIEFISRTIFHLKQQVCDIFICTLQLMN